MSTNEPTIRRLYDLESGEEADFFALLAEKQEAKTRDGKPYLRVTFRDAEREVSFPIWSDLAVYSAALQDWQPGVFYKLRAVYRETNYGPQLEIQRIRQVNEADAADGFDPDMLQAASRFDPVAMFTELRGVAEAEIDDEAVLRVVLKLLDDNKDDLLRLPAAVTNHHAYVGGYLEHVLNVVRTTLHLVDRYAEYYPELQPPLARDAAVAGAVLHDIGKLRELQTTHVGAEYTASGDLIGHILLGRDMLREAAAEEHLEGELLLRLEHVIVSHQRLPEWGSPKPPMTPEALIVHYADDLDAKFQMMVRILKEDAGERHATGRRNVLHQKVFRGESS